MPTNLPTGAKLMDEKNIKIINLAPSQAPINFMDGLALLLIGLKLGTNRLDDWTWIEVLSPLWIPIMIAWFLKLVIFTFGDKIEEDKN